MGKILALLGLLLIVVIGFRFDAMERRISDLESWNRERNKWFRVPKDWKRIIVAWPVAKDSYTYFDLPAGGEVYGKDQQLVLEMPK